MAEASIVGGAARGAGRPAELRVLELVGNAGSGGVEAHVGALVGALPALVRATVALPFDGALAQRLRAAGARVAILPLDDRDELAASVLRAIELVRRLRIDVIHAHLENAHAIAALASAVCGVPTFATIHAHYVPMREWEIARRGWSRLGLVCEAAYAYARTIGASAEQAALTPNGVDTVRFAPGPRGALRASLGVPADAPLVGFAGRLAMEKGPTDFVHAAARVAASEPRAHFIVAGEGPLRAACEAIAARGGIAERVRFAGTLAEMPPFYRELDVLLVPSFAEGGPLAVMEAMASEVPVVAASVGGVPEIVCHNVNGTLFRAGDAGAAADAVIALLRDEAARMALGRAARARILARFTLRRHVARVVDELFRTARRAHGVARTASVSSPAQLGAHRRAQA